MSGPVSRAGYLKSYNRPFFFFAVACFLICFCGPTTFVQESFAQAQQPRQSTAQPSRPAAGQSSQQQTKRQSTTKPRQKSTKKSQKKKYPAANEIMKAKSLHRWSLKYLDSYQRTREFEYLRNSAKYSRDSIEQLQTVQANLRSVNPEFHRARRLRLKYCDYYKTIYLESKVWGAMIDVQPLPENYCINP